MRFITPCFPKLRPKPPIGPEWLHEVKFDGYRVQLHKGPKTVVFSRSGADFTKRYQIIAEAIPAALRATTAIVDAELVAVDENGRPDFHALHLRKPDAALAVFCFDLLELNGEDMRPLALRARRAKLERIIRPPFLFSEAFTDPMMLLRACNERKLEGIVSKRLDATYRVGNRCDWIKVKCQSWKDMHKDRGKMFEDQS